MKAFISGAVAIIVIAIAAAVILNALGWTSAEVYSTANVRL